jgi:DNA-binding GntR family transcriptional regulator
LTIEFKASKGLTEQIAEYLGSRIIHMELKPGERLFEAKLAGEMGVSRAPVREALRMLEMSGLVEFMPRRGVRVSELSEKTVLAITDVLKEVLGLVALRGVENGTMEDYEILKTIGKSLSEYAEIEDISGYLNATL